MNDQPLISIIVPMYNSSKYIGKCLHSIMTQTYTNIEIILIDNNSTDNTRDICLNYASDDNRIRITEEPQKGVAFARNKGLDSMSGDYFFFLDADDYIKDTCIEKLYNALYINHTKIALSNFFYDLEDKNITYYDEDRLISGREFLKDALCRKFDLNPCWGILFESNTYKDLRFENYRLCEDELYITKQISRTSEIAFVSDTLLVYRDNKGSVVTAGKPEVFLDGIKAQEQILSYIEEEVPEYLPYAKCNYVTLALFILFKLKSINVSRKITSPIVRIIKKYRWEVINTKDASLETREVCLLSFFGLELTYRVFTLYQYLQARNNKIILEDNTDTIRMSSTLISVIVPVYNGEKFLTNCINSIVHQKHRNLEIIIVDDGSTDSTPLIADKIALSDPRIQVIHQDNHGLSAARNKGLEIASGEYLAFVDSDDFIHPDFLYTLLSDLYTYDTDVAVCRFRKISTNNGIIPDKLVNVNHTKIYNREFAIEALIESDSVDLIVAWNKLYKRKVFDDILFPVGKYCEDNYVAYEIVSKINKISFNYQPLYFYYQNLSGITHQRDDLSIYELEALDEYDKLVNRIITEKSHKKQILDKSLLKRTNMVVEDYYAAYKLKHHNRMTETGKHFEVLKEEFKRRNLKLNHKLRLFDKHRKLFIAERKLIEVVGNFKIKHNLY